MKKLLLLLAVLSLASKKSSAPQRPKPIEEELRRVEAINKAKADAALVAAVMASPEAQAWPEWLSVGLVSSGVAVAVGPELLTYYGLSAAAEMSAADVAALAVDAAQLIYGASQGAKSHIATVSGMLYQYATTPAQANFLRLLQSQLEGQGLQWIVEAAIK